MAIKANRLVVIIVVVALVGLVGYYLQNGGLTSASKKPYQAVFLTNGQVYFGKIAKRTPAHTVLEDIYYLQVQQPIQPAPEGQAQQQVQIQLVKLGNELHKPKDEMVVNNDQILFTEEIQADGQVGQTIEKHKRGETTEPATQTQTQTTPKK